MEWFCAFLVASGQGGIKQQLAQSLLISKSTANEKLKTSAQIPKSTANEKLKTSAQILKSTANVKLKTSESSKKAVPETIVSAIHLDSVLESVARGFSGQSLKNKKSRPPKVLQQEGQEDDADDPIITVDDAGRVLIVTIDDAGQVLILIFFSVLIRCKQFASLLLLGK